MEIIKRDGRKVLFDGTKIEKAVLKAFKAVDGETTDEATKIAREVMQKVEAVAAETTLSVEQIQDLVEDHLMESARKDVARAYIKYRDERTRVRNSRSELMQKIGEKLTASNVQRQNANVDEKSFGGRMGEARGVVTKQYALDHLMSETARANHLNNEVYTHDLDSFAVGEHNCLSVPIDDLLKNGFKVRQTDVRPAGSVATAMHLMVVTFQLQSLQQFGGVSATHLDWSMVPYVRKSFAKHYRDGLKYIQADKYVQFNCERHIDDEEYKANEKVYDYAMEMTKREVHQAVEAMYHELNTLQSRSGDQLPFSSINYGTCTLPEGRMVTKAILTISIEGLGTLHRTAIFPCGIFQMMKGVNRHLGDPNYDLYRLALKSTALRLYPNYANVDWSGNAGYDRNDPRTYFSTMGCRTANGFDINHDPGVNGQMKDGRGNICPVTIIMPTLAMEAKEGTSSEEERIDKFMKILDQKIAEARDQLIERFEWICQQPPESAPFMYQNHTMLGYDGKTTRSALKHGTLAVG